MSPCCNHTETNISVFEGSPIDHGGFLYSEVLRSLYNICDYDPEWLTLLLFTWDIESDCIIISYVDRQEC